MKVGKFFGVALMAGCLVGCGATFRHEKLALPGFLGANLDEPFGGELPTDNLGLTGAPFVTDWIEPKDRPDVKARGYRFPGTGAFDSKEPWTVQEWADRKTGRVDLLWAQLEVDGGRLKNTPGADSVPRIGGLLHDFLEQLLGVPTVERCHDAEGRPIAKPSAGAYEKNYLWIRDLQAIRLGLYHSKGDRDPDGTVTLEVQRLDALSDETRKTVYLNWGL